MNFPGLEPAWNTAHRLMRAAGIVRTWTLDEARASLAQGSGVVVVATTALGDSILCTPLLKSLADALGPGRVGLLVRESFVELYTGTPWIGWVAGVKGKFRGWRKIRQAVRAANAQVAFIANATEPDTVPHLWRGGVRGFLRYRTRWSRWADWFANRHMMRPPDHPDYATGHAIDNNLAMIEALGIHPTTRHLAVHVDALASTAVPADKPLVIIHPGASRAGKCWPLKNWAEVARALKHRFDCHFAITGGAAEKALAADLQSLLPAGTENRAGALGLRDLAVFQQSASLFLSGDTGPYHLAVAVGCPTVTLFAPRDRGSSVEACGPRGLRPERHRTLQTVQFNDPIDLISVDSVLEQAREVLQSVVAKT